MSERRDRTQYETAIAYGAAQYDDVIQTRRLLGYQVDFMQTGGMCGGLEAQLPDGTTLLITDAENELPWERSDHSGWCVGLYETNEYEDPFWVEAVEAVEAVEDGSVEALLLLLEQLEQR